MTDAPRSATSTILIPVFIPAVLVIGLLVVGTISNPEYAGGVFSAMPGYITETFGWLYMLSGAFFLVFIVSIACTRRGRIKLGSDRADPQCSFPALFAMLFSAGHGIALLFFEVAVPVLHYSSPPAGETVDVYGFDQHDVITDILGQFEKHLHFQHISPGELPWNRAEHDEMRVSGHMSTQVQAVR